MVRPFILRRVCRKPGAVYFKPAGVPLRGLRTVELAFEEAEALRLVDYKGLEQTAAAAEMGVSQPTLSRVLAGARRKVAEAVCEGKALEIRGGNFVFGGRK